MAIWRCCDVIKLEETDQVLVPTMMRWHGVIGPIEKVSTR